MRRKIDSTPPTLASLNAIGYFTFVLFVLYYVAAIFYQRWGGDFHLYIAAVSSLYRDLLNPLHEAVNVSGQYSGAFNPAIVTAAHFGKLTGLSEYQALQIVGVANVTLYAIAILIFFRVNSGSRLPGLTAGIFLAISLFLRDLNFYWSSETSYSTLMLIQAYPSLFAWGLSLLAFASFEHLVRTGSVVQAIVLLALLWNLILNHQITASWVIGILIVRVIAMRLLEPKQPASYTVKIGIFLTLILSVSIAGALVWPYMNLIGQFSYVGVQENPPFGQGFSFLTSMKWLYISALVSAALLWRRYEGRLLILYWLATASAFSLFKLIGFDFGMRYAFFMAFFAQALVALACTEIVSQLRRLFNATSTGTATTALRLVAGCLVLTVTTVGILYSPMLNDFTKDLARYRSFARQPGRDGSAEQYYNRHLELSQALSGDSVVLLHPLTHLAHELRTLSGASSVVAPYAYKIPDYFDREANSRRFFELGTSKAHRLITIDRYSVTHVLVQGGNIGAADELEKQFGPPIVRYKKQMLFDVSEIHFTGK